MLTHSINLHPYNTVYFPFTCFPFFKPFSNVQWYLSMTLLFSFSPVPYRSMLSTKIFFICGKKKRWHRVSLSEVVKLPPSTFLQLLLFPSFCIMQTNQLAHQTFCEGLSGSVHKLLWCSHGLSKVDLWSGTHDSWPFPRWRSHSMKLVSRTAAPLWAAAGITEFGTHMLLWLVEQNCKTCMMCQGKNIHNIAWWHPSVAWCTLVPAGLIQWWNCVLQHVCSQQSNSGFFWVSLQFSFVVGTQYLLIIYWPWRWQTNHAMGWSHIGTYGIYVTEDSD